MRFRNDDIDYYTDVTQLKQFCDVFYKYQFTQIHGVILRGQSAFPKILPNGIIMSMAEHDIEQNHDLIEFLNHSPDELALHGLYHTFYHEMPDGLQELHIQAGLEIMQRLFPNKSVTKFICPDNKYNDHTLKLMDKFNLEIMHDSNPDAIHLEQLFHIPDPDENLLHKTMRYHWWRWFQSPNFNLQPLDDFLGKLKTIHSNRLINYYVVIDADTANVEQKRLKQILLEAVLKLDLPEDAKILDVGCNSGWFMTTLEQNAFTNVQGIDIAHGPLEVAKKKNLNVQHMYAENLLFSDDTFDLIIMSSVLQQTSSPEWCLLEAKRTLKPEGFIIGFNPSTTGDWGYSAFGINPYVLNAFLKDDFEKKYNATVKKVNKHENYFQIKK